MAKDKETTTDIATDSGLETVGTGEYQEELPELEPVNKKKSGIVEKAKEYIEEKQREGKEARAISREKKTEKIEERLKEIKEEKALKKKEKEIKEYESEKGINKKKIEAAAQGAGKTLRGIYKRPGYSSRVDPFVGNQTAPNPRVAPNQNIRNQLYTMPKAKQPTGIMPKFSFSVKNPNNNVGSTFKPSFGGMPKFNFSLKKVRGVK